MLHKLFGVRTVKPPSRRQVPPKPSSTQGPAERSPALKIIHAGGRVECYYMAVPAARILEKQPSFVLARPDVFRRPWDSVVRPEEILTPGQKFFIVPRRTVKKLRRRIPRPTGGENRPDSFVSQPSIDTSVDIVSQQKDISFLQETDVSSISRIGSSKSKGKTKARNRRVRFFGIDTKLDSDSDSSFMEKKGNKNKDNMKKSFFGIDTKQDSDSSFVEKKGNKKDNMKKSFFGIDTKQDSNSSFMEKKGNKKDNMKKSLNPESSGRNRKVRNAVTWQPNLAVISESHSSDD